MRESLNKCNLDKPAYCKLTGKNEIPVYISPASELMVELSINNVTFTGEGKDINDFLQSREKNHKAVMSGFKDQEVFALPEKQFAHTIDSFANELIKPLHQLMEQKSISQEFTIKEKERVKYWKFDMLSTYHRNSPTFTQKICNPG
jgi:hypothetical protein